MEWTNYVNDTTGAAGVSPEQQRVGTTGHTSIDPLDEVISQTPFENKKPLYSHSAVRAGFPLREWRLRLPLRVGPGLAALAAVRGQSRPHDGPRLSPALRHLRRLQESRSGVLTGRAQ